MSTRDLLDLRRGVDDDEGPRADCRRAAVEWTDTILPICKHSPKVTRRMHGGVSNAKAYQLWISAVGPQPERNPIPKNIYPWLGFRVGRIGNLGNTNQ